MSELENVQIVQQMYTEFGQGNISAVLTMMAEDVIWKQPASGPAPFAGTVRGRERLGEWFSQMDAVSEVEAFEPQEFMAQGNKVVVLGHYKYRSRETGKRWESDWAMVWLLEDGKVVRGQIIEDTLAQGTAMNPT